MSRRTRDLPYQLTLKDPEKPRYPSFDACVAAIQREVWQDKALELWTAWLRSGRLVIRCEPDGERHAMLRESCTGEERGGACSQTLRNGYSGRTGASKQWPAM